MVPKMFEKVNMYWLSSSRKSKPNLKNFGSVSMCNFNIFRICAYLCGNLYQGDFFQEALVFVSRNLYFFLWEPFHSKAQWIEIFCDGAFFFLVK